MEINLYSIYHDDLDDSGVHNLNLTLSSTSAIEVCKYIRNNISANTIYQNGYSFNALVNGADFFSGTIYSDGGSTWWGIIQQRSTSINTNTIYKYLYIGGADSVTPFNSGLTGTVVGVYQFSLNTSDAANHPVQSYVCPKNGLFCFFYYLMDEGNGGSGYLYVNDTLISPTSAEGLSTLTPSGTNYYTYAGTYIVPVNAGDTVTYYAHTNSLSGMRNVFVRSDFIY